MTAQADTHRAVEQVADEAQGDVLLTIARAAIASRFGLILECHESDAFLSEPGASFVTLKYDGRLRGCIGTLQAHRSLLDDVRYNAQAAAFRDPRFSPLQSDEYNQTVLEVSLLSPLSPISVRDETDAIGQLRPGIDGLVLQFGNHRGTFLPQVWESLPEPEQFFTELKRKAGLAASFWSDELRLFRYHVTKWTEE
jgi:AmmeMemoRadiSam system protein A